MRYINETEHFAEDVNSWKYGLAMGSKATLLLSLCVSLCVRTPGALCPIFGTPVNMRFEEEPYKNNTSGHQGTPSVWPTQRRVLPGTVIGQCVPVHPVQINESRLLTQTSCASMFTNKQIHSQFYLSGQREYLFDGPRQDKIIPNIHIYT